ncbi:MAG: ShlB/FhaC/HecB family hemolysin secretion/activation protein [Schwartzia sp. (in: firmicutes)]
MKLRGYHALRRGLILTMAVGAFSSTALAASSLSQPGQEIKAQERQGTAEVENVTPERPAEGQEVRFTVRGIDLDAPDLKVNRSALAKILTPCLNQAITLADLNAAVDEVTRYCRTHGYPAAAAYIPVQDSANGTVKVAVIPGRYDEVIVENHSRLQDDVVRGFLNGLKKGSVIETASLETALYGISALTGTKAVGVLSPGSTFGSSNLTVRVEEGKIESTVLYVENYGNTSSGRYRYGVQENLYDVDGRGGKVSVGGMLSNHNMHNYYVNYETLVGRGGATLGLGFSRMEYQLGRAAAKLGANGTAHTISLFGSVPVYHLSDRELKVTYGFDYRWMKDALDKFPIMNREKNSQSAHVGITGTERRPGASLTYDATATVGIVNLTSRSLLGKFFDQNSDAKGHFAKVTANVTGVQAIGHVTDVTLKLQGQTSRGTLDSSEQMYLGGANGVRAYPQGEASGENGFLGSLEVRYHTPLPGLSLSAYFDTGHMMDKASDSSTTLKGWGVGVNYTQPNDWFARFDYARRIGLSANASEAAKSRARMWFMLGKVW